MEKPPHIEMTESGLQCDVVDLKISTHKEIKVNEMIIKKGDDGKE